MSFRLAHVALVFAFAAHDGHAAENDAASRENLERMTPTQLRELQAKLDREGLATRGENAALSQRIADLEKKNAELGTKKSELETQLADVLDRLEKLEAAKQDE